MSLKSIPGERWADAPGFEGLYQISTMGRLKSIARMKTNHGKKQLVKAKIKSQRIGSHGYYRSNLLKNGKSYTRTIHRLVALAFLEPSEKKQVNHKNGDRLDNRVENLEWVTNRENQRHRSRVLNSTAGQFKKRPVVRTNKTTGKTEQEYNSLSEARDWVRERTDYSRAHESKIGHAIDTGQSVYGYKWIEVPGAAA